MKTFLCNICDPVTSQIKAYLFRNFLDKCYYSFKVSFAGGIFYCIITFGLALKYCFNVHYI